MPKPLLLLSRMHSCADLIFAHDFLLKQYYMRLQLLPRHITMPATHKILELIMEMHLNRTMENAMDLQFKHPHNIHSKDYALA